MQRGFLSSSSWTVRRRQARGLAGWLAGNVAFFSRLARLDGTLLDEGPLPFERLPCMFAALRARACVRSASRADAGGWDGS
jgi:hypothetical protein